MRTYSLKATRAAFAVLLCLLGLLIPKDTLASGLPDITVPSGLGISVHYENTIPAQELSLLQNSGVTIARTDLWWSSIEYPQGSYNFSAYDRLVSQLTNISVRPLFIIDGSNTFYDGGKTPYDTAGQTGYANFAYAAAQHYAGQGVIWEIWNEPNLQHWVPTSDPNYWKWINNVNAYIALLKAAVAQIRRADPNATILAGVTSGLPQDYIEAFLRSGALSGVDALSVHPYRSSNPETVAAEYSATRALIARYTPSGQSPLPIVSSEWGYSTTTATNGGGVSQQCQAAYILRQYLANLAAGVNTSVFYDFKDDGPDNTREYRFGTVDNNNQPKPSYLAVQQLVSNLRGYRFCHRLATSSPSDYKLLFQGPTDLETVEWMATDPTSDPNPSLPQFTHILPGNPLYSQLQEVAAIQYPSDTLAATTTLVGAATPKAPLNFTVKNPFSTSASIIISNNGQQQSVTVPANSTTSLTMSMSLSTSPGVHPIDLSFTWNSSQVPGIVPPDALTVSEFVLSPYPSGSNLAVDVTNPLTTSFTGQITYQMAGGSTLTTRTMPVNNLGPGQTTTIVFSGNASQTGSVQLTDSSGVVWGRCATEQYVADTNWPSSLSQSAPYWDITFTDAGAGPNNAVSVAATSGFPLASVAVALPYVNDTPNRFDTLTSKAAEPIPGGANGLLAWVLSDGSGVDYRARFQDANGQMFQPEGGPLDYAGWHLVNLALDGSTGQYWGGPNDDLPSGQLNWTQFALADGHGGYLPYHSGVLNIAAPSYAYASFGCSYHSIVNVASNYAVVVSGGSTQAGASLIQGWTNGTSNGLWKFVSVGNGKYQIVNQNSGLLINIPGASTTSGTPLIQYSNDGNLNSQWYIVPIGGGRYRIVSAYDSQLLDVSGSSTTLFAAVDQANSNGSTTQQWYIY